MNQVSVENGDEVSSGAALVQIADFEHMQVSFRVDEYDIGDVQVGERCTVTATATEKVFESTVESINYISSSTGNVAYYTATAHVDVDGEVYPGMQVTVTIPQEEAADVVILKAEALSFTLENQAFVYKMKEDQSLEEVQVEVGVSNGNYVEIKSGLESGEKVYTVSETKEDSLTSLFAGMFGQQRFNRQNGTRRTDRTRTGDRAEQRRRRRASGRRTSSGELRRKRRWQIKWTASFSGWRISTSSTVWATRTCRCSGM